MAHEDLLNLEIFFQCLCNWCHLLVCKSILEQVQVSQWQKVEQIREGITTDLVIVDIDIAEVGSVLEDFDELLGTFVVDLIVGEL